MSNRSRMLKGLSLRIRRRTKPGAVPGTVRVDPESPKPEISLIGFGPEGVAERQVDDPAQLGRLVREFPVSWINVDGLGDAGTIMTIGQQFDLHPLALEDVVNVHQRPKVEEYADHLFVVARMPAYNEGFETEQICFFVGKDFLLTFQERPGDCLEPVRQRLRKNRGQVRNSGPDYLLYALLDAVVDSYFPVIEQFGERLGRIEERIASETRIGEQAIGAIRSIRAELLVLRKTVWWTRDAVNVLIREPHPLVSDGTRIYLRDCYDHTVQLIDVAETFREITGDLRDYYFSKLSVRSNDIMKVLTIIATIFIPLSFVAGLYGMNFQPDASPWNMPELGWRYGYPFALGVMLAVAVSMLVFFWRRGWLGRLGR